MSIYKKRSNKKWQKEFINNVFKNKSNTHDTFSKIVINDLSKLEFKENYIPKIICKYYAPTSDNILDIQKKRLWLSHPSNFNDPFDCNTGYDIDEYEKHMILDYIKTNGCVDILNEKNGFTEDDKNMILKSKVLDYWYYSFRKIERYDDVIRNILNQKNDDFQLKISNLKIEANNNIENKMEKLRSANIRIGCFSEIDRYENFGKKIQMWSHYADNHKGFCAIYDLSPLKEISPDSLNEHNFYIDQEKYINEELNAVIKGCLFPVIYTSNRVNIPVTKLKKIRIDETGKLKDTSDIESILYKTFIVKSANWSYEKEWRLVIDGNISNYFDDKIPFPFIKKIYLGCKMEEKLVETMFEIGEEIGIEVIMLKMDSKKFILEETSSYKREWKIKKRKWENPFS